MTEPGADGVALRLLVMKTHQLDRVREFYEALGIRLAEERHGRGPLHYAGKAGAALIEVYPLPDDAPAPDASVRLGFDVMDLDRVLDALQRLGAPVVAEPQSTQWGYRAVVRDPDGRAVELYGPGERRS